MGDAHVILGCLLQPFALVLPLPFKSLPLVLPLPFPSVFVLAGFFVESLVSDGIFASLEELLVIECVGGEQAGGLGCLHGGLGCTSADPENQ